MKAKLFFTSAIAVALTLSFSSCSQNGGYDTAGYDTATPIADGEIPPWIAENSDPTYESGGYNPVKENEDKLAYNPPAKPKVNKPSTNKGSKAKGKKNGGKAKGKAKSSGSKNRTYKVKKGDTLGAIARRHGTTVKAIKRANGLKSDMIHINQKLSIPRK